jgi:hypothetical protein
VAERRTYHAPPDVRDGPRLRHEAQRRRTALAQAGCSTYQLGTRGGVEAIICLCCGLGSAHPKDMAERYCGFCQSFHTEWSDP